jgi:hypothetical protein
MSDAFLRWVVTYGQLAALLFAVLAALAGGLSGFAGMEMSRRSDDKLADVLRKVGTVIGGNWIPLTSAQIETLREKIAALKPTVTEGKAPRAQVMYENAFGKELAASFALAFRAAGWNTTFTTGSGFENGIEVGPGPLGLELQKAIEDATGIKSVRALRPEETDRGFYFLGVGAKTD